VNSAAAAAILVTGMSGAGKTTALNELAARGYDTVDTDIGGWIEVVDGEPLWRTDVVSELLRRPRRVPLFVQGTVANQGVFYDRFDAIVLLTAPLEVLLHRVSTRPAGDFGAAPADRDKIAADRAEVEPLLRRGATHEIDTTASVTDVADELARIAGAARHGVEHPGREDRRWRRIRTPNRTAS